MKHKSYDKVFALVFNRHFMVKAKRTLLELRKIGLWDGHVLIIIPDNLSEDEVKKYLNDSNISVFSYPMIDRTEAIETIKARPFLNSDGREINKTFQYHKLYLFHPKTLNMAKKIVYIDCGMSFFNHVQPLLNIKLGKYLYANSDSFPYYERMLRGQFESRYYEEEMAKMEKDFELDIDYFQTTFMIYKTQSIPIDAFDIMLSLSKKFPNSKTNEQGIMNLYFTSKLKIWKQLPLMSGDKYTYDFYDRGKAFPHHYIMLKYYRKSNLVQRIKKYIYLKYF